jgi:hypothetical protein
MEDQRYSDEFLENPLIESGEYKFFKIEFDEQGNISNDTLDRSIDRFQLDNISIIKNLDVEIEKCNLSLADIKYLYQIVKSTVKPLEDLNAIIEYISESRSYANIKNKLALVSHNIDFDEPDFINEIEGSFDSLQDLINAFVRFTNLIEERDLGEYDDYYDDSCNYEESESEYAGSYAHDVEGLSDDFIDDVLDGDPDNYWNID